MERKSFRAKWVLPIDGPPLPDGTVTVEDGQIKAIGRFRVPSAELHDLGNVILMPGLVNAHTHLEFSDLQRPLGKPDQSLHEWIRVVIGTRKRSDRSHLASIQIGLRESFRAGVTTLGDIATGPFSAYDSFSGSHLIPFQEVIGFSAGRIESIHSDLTERLAPADYRSVGISPHAPYTVHPELLRRLVDLSSDRHLPVAMHLAESAEEIELLATGSGPLKQLLLDRSMWDPQAIPVGSTPLDYLQILARAPRGLVIHGNFLNEKEIAFLAEQREKMSVVYCPRTHNFFDHPPYPLLQMLAAGVRVAVGTDSRASNPDLNLLAELCFIKKRYPSLPAETILRLGTLSGAEALGLAAHAGSLTTGKWADMIAIGCPQDVLEPAEYLLGRAAMPRMLWVRGVPHQLAH